MTCFVVVTHQAPLRKPRALFDIASVCHCFRWINNLHAEQCSRVRQSWDFCEKETQNPVKVAIHPIMEAFQNAMIARLLPISDKSMVKSPLDASAHPREPVAGEPCF